MSVADNASRDWAASLRFMKYRRGAGHSSGHFDDLAFLYVLEAVKDARNQWS